MGRRQGGRPVSLSHILSAGFPSWITVQLQALLIFTYRYPSLELSHSRTRLKYRALTNSMRVIIQPSKLGDMKRRHTLDSFEESLKQFYKLEEQMRRAVSKVSRLRCHSLLLRTPSRTLEPVRMSLDPDQSSHARTINSEMLDASLWAELTEDTRRQADRNPPILYHVLLW